MTTDKVYLTPETHKRLQEELDQLRREKRQEVADRIQEAKEIGGTVDNAEYDDAKNEQSFIEGRIQELERKLHEAVFITEHASSDRVQMGSHVIVQNDRGVRLEYLIVGVDDADPPSGKISHESPVGKALLEHGLGEHVQVETPRGTTTLTIVEIR